MANNMPHVCVGTVDTCPCTGCKGYRFGEILGIVIATGGLP